MLRKNIRRSLRAALRVNRSSCSTYHLQSRQPVAGGNLTRSRPTYVNFIFSCYGALRKRTYPDWSAGIHKCVPSPERARR